MQAIKAIPTGKYRSKTEWRWSITFCELNLEFEYEPRLFWLGADLGWYLPDFHISGVWLEIKGCTSQVESSKALQKMRKVSHITKEPGIVVVGSPWDFVVYAAFEESSSFTLGDVLIPSAACRNAILTAKQAQYEDER